MIAQLRVCTTCMTQGHAEFVQQVIEPAAQQHHLMMQVEEFSALLLWPRKGLEKIYGRASRESTQNKRCNHAKRSKRQWRCRSNGAGEGNR